METITMNKVNFGKILNDVETLIEDVEIALSPEINKRIEDIETGKVKGKTEEEYYDYVEKRGVKFA